MKPSKTFKLSKAVKTMIALMGGTNEDRNHFKRIMIQAQLESGSKVKETSKSSK